MPDGLVSTIIPVYNRGAMLREAVASVLGQTYRPIEIVIVDDGSTDDTPAVADALAAENPDLVRVVRQENGGPGAAREAGRLALRGEFVQHLDSDDLLMPRKFELQVAALAGSPASGVAYGWTRLDDGVTPHKGTGRRVETMFPSFLLGRWWDTSTPLYRRSLIDLAGPWTGLRMEEDWEYDARVASLGVHLAFVEAWVSETRARVDGLSGGERGLTPEALRDRARAHELILGHAHRAGIDRQSPEVQHFGRELFLLARQCGAAGLAAESQRLVELARGVDGGADIRLYHALAGIIGWSTAGKLACMTDRLRA
ncbi:MAG: glycosyl transferase [Acidobacteria bacterium]|nr:glycosyl transferase [Acidobacteriota bacterium]